MRRWDGKNLFTGAFLSLPLFRTPPLLLVADAANNSKRHGTKIGPAELCNTRLRNFIVCWPHATVFPRFVLMRFRCAKDASKFPRFVALSRLVKGREGRGVNTINSISVTNSIGGDSKFSRNSRRYLQMCSLILLRDSHFSIHQDENYELFPRANSFWEVCVFFFFFDTSIFQLCLKKRKKITYCNLSFLYPLVRSRD